MLIILFKKKDYDVGAKKKIRVNLFPFIFFLKKI